MEIKHIKTSILDFLNNLLDQKITTLKNAIQSARESRNSDTKSSMGDKYETSRAMIQIEIEKFEQQLMNTQMLKNEIGKIDPNKKVKNVSLGSLIATNEGTYFISAGLGKIEINNHIYYCISTQSPIGQFFLNRKVGEKLVFQNREIWIESIL